MSGEVPPDKEHGRIFWASLAIGWALMAFGVGGAIVDARSTNPPTLALWLAGSLVAHDLVIVPLVFAVGITVRRTVPAWARALVQAGLIVTGVVALYSIPLLGGFGRDRANPSILPGSYGLALLVTLGLVWTGVGAVLAWGWRRRRRAS
jgi:hypothetical protein